MTARAHRIEVDRCGDCPFLRSDSTLECIPPVHLWSCAHPIAPPPTPGPVGPQHLTLAPSIRVPGDEPPAWCPLRGSVTMVAGPRVDGGAS